MRLLGVLSDAYAWWYRAPVQNSLFATLRLVAGDVHEAHPGVLAQLRHALAVLHVIEARCDKGLTLGLQPAHRDREPSSCAEAAIHCQLKHLHKLAALQLKMHMRRIPMVFTCPLGACHTSCLWTKVIVMAIDDCVKLVSRCIQMGWRLSILAAVPQGGPLLAP